MVNTRTKTSFVWWSRLLAGAVILFPFSISKTDYRAMVSQGLSISANKASPAYAAFEDLHLEFPADSTEIPDNGTRLASGTPADMKMVAQATQARAITLSGMTIRQPQQPIPQQPIYIAQNNAVKPAPLEITDDDGELLPLNVRKQILAKQVKDEEWMVMSAADRARELVEQEVQAMAAMPAAKDARVIVSKAGTPIVIGRGLSDNATSTPTPARLPVEEPKKDREDDFVASLTGVFPAVNSVRPLWLNGQVEMTGGLAFVGPETAISVMRIVDGEIQERGRVWISEGRFEIHVKKPVGYLVAELHTSDGRVLGRGEINMVHLTEVPVKDNRIDEIRLALRPTSDGAAFRTISGYSHDNQKLPVKQARVEIQDYTEAQKVNDDGVVFEQSLSRDSSFVARATAPMHWASVVVGQAHHQQDIRLFSNSLVEALVELNLNGSERKEAFLASIVWGQALKDGKPVAGAHVEMAGSYEPIYFNQLYLPDKSMKKTGPNGLFAFLRVKAGVQALRVKANGRMYPAQIFPTENKHVSYVHIELRDKLVSQFRVFDVLDFEKRVSARIRLVGTEEILPVTGQQLVEYAMAADPFMVEAEAGPEYEVSRTTMTGAPHLVQVPLVRKDWLYDLYVQKGIVTVPGRGMVAGFVDDQDYEIELTGMTPQDPAQIVYFDGQGKVLENQKGVAGGGFIVFNAPPGLQTIYLHPAHSRETFSQVIVAEPQYVHVLTWAARQ